MIFKKEILNLNCSVIIWVETKDSPLCRGYFPYSFNECKLQLNLELFLPLSQLCYFFRNSFCTMLFIKNWRTMVWNRRKFICICGYLKLSIYISMDVKKVRITVLTYVCIYCSTQTHWYCKYYEAVLANWGNCVSIDQII